MNIADIRNEYSLMALDESAAAASPFDQFQRWFGEALNAEVAEANAMTLATVAADGRPAARIMLIKALDERGVTFFSNYESRKGHELSHNGHAALLFFWPALQRQIRIEGVVEKIPAAESDQYFASRPLGSRLGACASPQSREIASRAVLAARFEDSVATLGDHPPRPPHWGGYRLIPDRFEFWQGRESRLHDRIGYQQADGGWRVFRLAP